jgi:hypothetical protein
MPGENRNKALPVMILMGPWRQVNAELDRSYQWLSGKSVRVRYGAQCLGKLRSRGRLKPNFEIAADIGRVLERSLDVAFLPYGIQDCLLDPTELCGSTYGDAEIDPVDDRLALELVQIELGDQRHTIAEPGLSCRYDKRNVLKRDTHMRHLDRLQCHRDRLDLHNLTR